MGATDSTSYRYWAFISYSSKDKSWARWLHRAVETYGIPARLVSHPTPAGEPAPRRFRPLFHDRAELPASADLGVQIEEALRESRYLIVICSPHAARSKWVNKEVETFQRLDRPGRVLAVIVDGEPNAGDERECFPPALRKAEPIAADVRREGDGKGNAKLKLLAGMLGVGFDGLKQRDTHRRIRRLQFAIGLALVLALGFAGLALYANRQRDKAVKARQQAESILEYLLYDLRDKLEPVGRLDIVRDVQERVDAYYRELGIEKRDPNTLRNRAVAFDNKGDRLLAEGDLAGALREYRVGLQIMERLASSDSSNAGWQRDVSVSHCKVGEVLQAQGDLAGALREYQAGSQIMERLLSSDPNNTDWQRDVSASHGRVGDVLVVQGDLAGALREYRVALQIMERLASSDSSNAGWQRDVSVSHCKVGEVLQAQGDLAGALREYRVDLQIMERLLSSDRSNTIWQRDVSVSHNRVGEVLQAQGDLVGALREYRANLEVRERLASSDPSNAGWQRDVFLTHDRIGSLLQAQGDLAGALRECQIGLQIIERLLSSDPSNADWQRDVSASYIRLAVISEKTGQGDAMIWWRKAYDQLSSMKQRGIMAPADEEYLVRLRQKVGR